MIGKICKYIIISVLILLFVLTLLLTINSSFRRTIFTNSFAAINLYYIVSIQTHLKNRYDVEGASNKLLNYIEFSKKIANGKSKLLHGIYDATKLVESKASTKQDYLILENVFESLVDIDPTLYEARVWLAKSYYYKKQNHDSLLQINKAIEISPVQDKPYRLGLKIAREEGDDELFRFYCDKYKNSTFGGNLPRYKESYFGGNVITKIALEFYPRENGNQKIYTHSGIILNDYFNYEFVPVEPIDIEGVNIYLSFLSGITMDIKEIILSNSTVNKKLIKKNMFASSKFSFIDNNKDYLSFYISDENDEIINLNFNNMFEDVDKIVLKIKFSKLDLTNHFNCL
jgi:hypothetical protein